MLPGAEDWTFSLRNFVILALLKTTTTTTTTTTSQTAPHALVGVTVPTLPMVHPIHTAMEHLLLRWQRETRLDRHVLPR